VSHDSDIVLKKAEAKIARVRSERLDIATHLKNARVKLACYQLEEKLLRRRQECGELGRLIAEVRKDCLEVE
jgi:hypothetical protein